MRITTGTALSGPAATTLKAAGISPIYMKGTGNLIDKVYDDIGERIIGDIDFVILESYSHNYIRIFEIKIE